ncbi:MULTISPECIES: lysine--tRNA ligase [Pseudoalteromonas]|uniref:Lysine--tRNA ligase n=1 Tax=Pseudoalteromonas ruthenica TaxID=151081 RepID=A0A0F4PNJ5_9GAMM|nr:MULTISPECIES: lysine--tRNA ligase [Pseudoalteromonas]KJY94465.1 lysyl-tRNA synthetase [Pseudoalteromonas ruthenica]KJY97080.1 lysyl-tRNA synthetase [Pseudoalteromonas ruthenica]MCF2863295.1 lysine--tRNA ligase [Pseudoalteromonas sp. CNAT2-18]MCG7558248.1 lysine--tRNA ligase [Pseudoalteromonas sp. CNAT2-18.1]MCG7567825.1 lysine--tRNA ligase [Pseudoalteromonas sp. CnMc7-15]|tara:strand:+ start:707 stop:2242 length:1536 start_codon:yes stop_codon:yes gene_type:complete
MTDQIQDENKLIAERRAKLDAIRENCSANGHPNGFRRKHYTADLQAEFGDKSKEELVELDHQVAVAGRILAKRGPFMVLQDMKGRVQAYASKDVQKDLKAKYGQLDIGDIIGVAGPLHKSGKGDLYVDMHEYELLTKSLRPLPEKFHGLSDQETKYRQRYVDLITNMDTRETFRVRSKIIEGIRRFLAERDFMEVETPMLQVIPGGATARPFVTHHNALDIDMYLRIAPELYLKRLVVGGFDRVFEINRNFRNEGLSTRHNPEFTMIEFYQAYADYNDLMNLTEDMLRTVAQDVLGTTTIVNTTKNDDGEVIDSVEYDFGQPFTRLSMADAIIKYNPDFDAQVFADPENHLEQLIAYAKQVHVKIPDNCVWGAGKYMCEIFEETAEHQLIQPTFITEYPWEVSPLARRNDANPFVTDRFEFFVGGRELANGFSELNDAEDQAARFARQVEEKDAGDDEAMHFDDDYIRALEYGLPPTAGEGIGIDRLVMLFTDSPTIKDVILFPHMRPEQE